MIFSQSCPNYFPFLLSSLPLKLHFGHFPLFFSFYIQLSVPFHVFLLRAHCLLDIFLFFLHYMSNFHFHFMSSFSERPVFWIFSLFFFNICPIFTSISCLPSPSALSFGHFPYLSSIYIQFSLPFLVFLLRVPCLLDIFLIFLQYMSNFHFLFLSSFSGYPVFWIFSFSFFNICPIFHHSPTIQLPIIIKFGYIAIRSALYVQSISVNT